MNKSKLMVVALLAVLIGGFFAADLDRYFTLEFFKSQQQLISDYASASPGWAALLYAALYIGVTALSLPGAALLTLAGGAIFGLLWGTILVSFASTLGATAAFLVARLVLRDAVQRRFGATLAAANAGVERDGPFYLFTLRLVPAFPFFVVNLVMGLTPMRVGTYYWVSQVGMFPATLVYVNAGTQIAGIESLAGILSPELLISFALLGVFPLVAKKALEHFKARQVLRNYPRPRRFDRNLVVIGAGSAGLVTAYIAAAVKANVTLIEKHRMGGDCLNTGCVPSKALIRSARFLADVRRAQEFGFKSASADFDFSAVMERVQRVIARIEPHDSIARYSGLGVECIQGEARVVSPYSVAVNGRTLTTRGIVIATGARPAVPALPGLEHVRYWTSDSVWSMRELPQRLLVLGGGPIGCELAQCFARFGSRVTLVHGGARLLPREDGDVSAMVTNRFRAEGVEIHTGQRAQRIVVAEGRKHLLCDGKQGEMLHPFDEILFAVGRTPNTQGFGLEELGIALTRQGAVAVNEYLQTRFPSIYACGDVAGPYQFTHAAAHQAWYAAVNALFGSVKKFRVDYSVMPWATFTDPEVARVGLNEDEARAQGVAYEVTHYDLAELDRAIADEDAQGMVKVLTVPGKDRILGVTIVGSHAGDLISEYVAALRHGMGLNKILGTIHIYPTLAEANKYAAGEWKRAHAPASLLRWVQRYHTWLRG